MDLEKHLDEFYTIMHRAARRSFRKKIVKSNPHSTLWSPDLREWRSKVRALARRLKNTRESADIRIRYKRELAQYKKEIMKRKRGHWLMLCTHVKDRFGLVFKLAHGKMLRPERLVNTVLSQATGLDTRSDVYMQFIESVLGGGDSETGRVSVTTMHTVSRTRFTEEEVQKAVSTLHQDKAPGLDLIDVKMVRCLNKVVKGFLGYLIVA